MKRLALALLALVLMVIGQAWAQDDSHPFTVRGMMLRCEVWLSVIGKPASGEALFKAGMCEGYVYGVMATMREYQSMERLWPEDIKVAGYRACAENATTDAIAQVFVNFARRHPELWDSAAEGIAIAAFGETWPCPPQ